MITIIGQSASELRTFSHLSFASFLLVMKEKKEVLQGNPAKEGRC